MFASLVLAGCASSTKQSDAILAKPFDVPASHLVADVPFVEQSAGHCGPATLTMAMRWAGQKVEVEDLVKQVYSPGAKGSFQLDMISAARRQGMLAIPIEGFESLFSEVRAGHPVIVFENLGISWLPQWHYAVVFGYDLQKQKLVLHSGPNASQEQDMREFERSWKLGKYWGLVVLPPGRLSASAGEMSHLKATAALEKLGHLEQAQESYLEILKRWPESLAAYIGLANVAFAQKNHLKAIGFLEKATQAHPHSAMAWHNLSVAYGASNNDLLAKKSALRAMNLAAPEAKPSYEKSLAKWLN